MAVKAAQTETQESGKLVRDPELVAMDAIAKALSKLGGEELERVVQWIAKKWKPAQVADPCV